MKFILLYFLLSLSPQVCKAKSTSTSNSTGEYENTEYVLVKNLLVDYDHDIRPVVNENDVLNITIICNELALLTVDQSTETVVFSAEFVLQWKDEFLSWDPSKHNNIKWIKVKESAVWKPDVVVSTSIEKQELLKDSEKYVDLNYKGTVRMSMYAVYTNLCNMQVDRFPYDSQICMIEVGPWSYTSDEITVVAGDSNKTYDGNSEWEFVSMTSEQAFSTDPDVGFNYTTVHFFLNVKRKPLFYVWVLLIPTFIITTVCICGLFIPTTSIGDREEKVNLGLTTLLSSAVILQMVSNSMPKTSALPILGNFILAEIFVVAIGVVFSIIILVFHNRANTRSWLPPRWVLKFLHLTGSQKFLKKKEHKMKPINEAKQNGANEKVNQLYLQLHSGLEKLTSFIQDSEKDRTRELAWLEFFDRIDMALLVFFFISNSIITWILCDP